MSLVLVPEKSSVTTTCTTMVVGDVTGNYQVTTNPTGYGAPNQARSTLNLLLLVNLRKSTGREVIAVPTYVKTTASTWSITIAEDGWYEIYFFGCLEYDIAITYATGYIAYDTSSDTYYKSVQDGNVGRNPLDTDWWVPTTDIEDFAAAVALAQPNVYQATKDTLVLCNGPKCRAQALLKAGCGCNDDCTLKNYEKVRMKIEGALDNEGLGDFTEAQLIIEGLNKLCEDIDCNCAGCQ